MDERKFIGFKKQEFGIKEYIKRDLGKGKISRLDIEYTPIGEKIIILTSKPGLVIGRRGEKIEELTEVLKKRFKLENPHIEIKEIEHPLYDAQLVADEISMALERMGNLKFKVIAYRKLQEIIAAGALGCEIRLSGKLPSERAKSWRFAEGYLKKAGDSRKEVDRAKTTAITKTGMIGIKVAIMSPYARIYDRINIDDKILNQIKQPVNMPPLEKEDKKIEEPKEKIKKSVKLVKTKKKKEVDEEIGEEVKVIEESPKLKPEEQGTAMKIEEEIKEGVPQDIIDEEEKKVKKRKSKNNDEEDMEKDNKEEKLD